MEGQCLGKCYSTTLSVGQAAHAVCDHMQRPCLVRHNCSFLSDLELTR